MATKGAKTTKKKTTDPKKQAKKTSKGSNLETKIEELNHSLEQEKEKFLRLFAEFENFKKRTSNRTFEVLRSCPIHKTQNNIGEM